MTRKTAQPQDGERPSKIDGVIALLRCERGASLGDIFAATGWQPPSARAALTGLRQSGHRVTREKREGVSRYSIRNEQ